MGEPEVSLRSVQRLHSLDEEQVKDTAKVVNAEDETEEAAERRASKRGEGVRSSNRKGKQAEEVVTRELMGINVVDTVSLELRLLKLNNDCYGNSRSSGIVLNVVPQEFVANMERSLARGEDAASASSSGKGDKDDSVMDLKSAVKQGDTSTALSQKDTTFLAELTRVIQRGGDWKKLTLLHMKAYLRHHGLRISGVKKFLVKRVEQHLKIKAGQGEDIHPRSSFIINCQGDACRGDNILFLQTVYNSRWVAGKVVHKSYGAKEQQHNFTIEVLWSTGTKPCHFMDLLRIKGCNLYRMHTWRQPWINEEDRVLVLDEKHKRGKGVCEVIQKKKKLKPKGLIWLRSNKKEEEVETQRSELVEKNECGAELVTQVDKIT